MHTGSLTTHVLDTSLGQPASGMEIELWYLGVVGEGRQFLKKVATNADGRTEGPLIAGDQFRAGEYELIFCVGHYFRASGRGEAEHPFLNEVPVRFGIADANARYHIPLLVSPYAYSTYRGS
jgi:5-hydroxyisourate hydrolase